MSAAAAVPVPAAAVAGLGLSTLICLLLPLLAWWMLRRRIELPGRNIVIGGATFLIAAVLLEGALNRWMLSAHTPLPVLRAHGVAFVIYGIAAAGIFEEVGRYLAMRYFVQRVGDAGTALSYGIGHGGIEAVLIGALGLSSRLVVALLINAGHQPSHFGALAPRLQALTLPLALVPAIERISAFVFQLCLSLLVWRAVTRRSLLLLLAAVLAHAAMDLPAALFQAGIWRRAGLSGPELEAGYALLAVLLIVLVLRPVLRGARSPAP